MRNRALPIVFVLVIVALISLGVIYSRNHAPSDVITTTPSMTPLPAATPSNSPSPGPSASLSPSRASNINPDLSVNADGLSKATVAMNTNEGLVRFKFYPLDAPNTVKRIIELVNQGFYNGLTFHRVEPGFVVQGGDPQGNGTGGSGQKIKAEFNSRRHIEGAVAMARAADPDSADSQFYIALGTLPTLDRSYTVFGQVVEGMDVVRKIRKGDKIVSMIIE
jgi:cyclophilin family peptidyl-prolyl cis-trans isomerase